VEISHESRHIRTVTRTDATRKLFEGFHLLNPHDSLKGRFASPKSGTQAAVKGFVGPQNKNNELKAKRIMKKTIIYLQMTALFLAAALPGAMAAETPFQGSFQAVEVPAIQFPTVTIAGIGEGTATQLGKFTMTYEAEVNLLTGVGVGSVEFVAANGDRVFADLLGHSTPTPTPNVISIVETLTITGGTGRFAGATGSLISTRLKNQVTGNTSGSFDGTIVIH
jgi:hypothetical protein